MPRSMRQHAKIQLSHLVNTHTQETHKGEVDTCKARRLSHYLPEDTASVLLLFESVAALLKHSTTSLIDGRSLGFLARQLLASLAISRAAPSENSLRSLGSMIKLNFQVSTGYCLTQSNSFCSFGGRFLSSERLPVRIS